MSPPDAVKHTHIHAIDLAVSNKTELAIAVRTLEQHTAGRFAVVKEDGLSLFGVGGSVRW